MGSILMLAQLFLIVLTSGRTVAIPSTDISDWGEKGEVWRWNVEEFPNPQTHPKFCQRYAPSNICDPDSILTKEEADNLDHVIRRVYNETECLCPGCSSSSGGIIIGIAVMKHIYLPYNEHKSAVIRDFADELRRLWDFGDCKNDIIIVLVTKDRVSSTSVGPGISSYISPHESRIFLDNKGYFTIEKYYEGLMSMVQAYYDLSRSIKLEREEDDLISAGLVAGIILGVLLLLVLITLVGCSLRRRLSNTHSIRKESWDGDPSLSWKKTQYQRCTTQDFGEKQKTAPKHGDTENNNHQFTEKGLHGGHASDEGNDTVGPNKTLLTTVAEFENEGVISFENEGDISFVFEYNEGDNSANEQSAEDQNTNDKEGAETEVKYAEAEISSPQAFNRGTITNL